MEDCALGEKGGRKKNDKSRLKMSRGRRWNFRVRFPFAWFSQDSCGDFGSFGNRAFQIGGFCGLKER